MRHTLPLTKIVLALVLTLAFTGLFQAKPDTVLAEGEPLAPAEIISASSYHTCALKPDGSVDCWGSNYFGQVSGTPDPSVYFGTLPGPYTQVSTGEAHTCALTPSGAVDCWGRNVEGQSADQPGPYTQVSAGVMYTCALTPSGTVDCWGDNTFGQADDQPGSYTQVSAGGDHTCALMPSGAIDCWGRNSGGQAEDQPGPYSQVSAGEYHNCALTPSGAVDCWGDNIYGQAVDQPGPYMQVSAVFTHTCALTPSGTVDCWGDNTSGQAEDQPGPYSRVSGGMFHTCALRTDRSIDCWGPIDPYYDSGQAADQAGPYGPYAPTSIVVTSDADGGPDTLRQALADIATGGMITFAGDMTIHLASELDLTRDVTIDGSGLNVVISGDNDDDGAGETRLFDVWDITASLSHLTLEKGYVYSNAGGGAIHNGGNLTVAECAFYGNSADSNNGGAIYNGLPSGTLTVTDSIFSGNTSIGSILISEIGNGGAIYSYRPLTVTNSIFTNNTASYGGGAINQQWVAATITNSTFSGNSATYGGAIYNYGDLTVSGNLFSNNRAINFGSEGSKGGAIFNDWYGTLTATNNTFFGNSSEDKGGGIFNYYDATMILTNNTFSGNTATQGGGIYQYSYSSSNKFYNNIIAKSTGGNCSGVDPTYSYRNRADDSTCQHFGYSSSILLGTLGNYGGPTQTIPLLPGSSAINWGYATNCPATDQRGLSRVGICDIGAFESQGFSLAVSSGDDQQALSGVAFTAPLEVTVSSAPGEPVDGGLVTFTAPADGASAVLTGSPAIIVDGKASVTAVANSLPGSYIVTASAAGAASMSFNLSNVLPQPALSALSPASATAGSADLTLAVTGSNFVDVSVVRWNGADLVTTFVSASELTALIPAANLASLQTAQITVYTPAPGGETSNVLAFFVTQAAADVSEQDVASGMDPSAAIGATTATATGDGLLAVAQYDANPGGMPSFIASDAYFDVYAAPGNNFTQVSIVACGMDPNDKLFWWDVEQGKWQKANPQSYDQATGCITLIVDADSSPSLSQLQGTFFAAGNEPDSTPPTVSVTGVTNGSTYILGAVPAAGCSTTDAESGVAVYASLSLSGGNALGTGQFTAACSGAKDNAGNSASPVSVQYNVAFLFTGFSQPVDNHGVLNIAKAGQTIPLKFRITDANGNPVTNLTSVIVTAASLACPAGVTIDQIEEYAAGSSGFQNLGNGYYQWNWKTPTTYINSCKTLKLDLGEGIFHTALFQFKK